MHSQQGNGEVRNNRAIRIHRGNFNNAPISINFSLGRSSVSLTLQIEEVKRLQKAISFLLEKEEDDSSFGPLTEVRVYPDSTHEANPNGLDYTQYLRD